MGKATANVPDYTLHLTVERTAKSGESAKLVVLFVILNEAAAE